MTHSLIQKLESNWELYTKLVGRISDEEVKTSLLTLCEDLKDRMAAAPASTQTKFVGAYPGGLVEYSLNVLKVAKEFNEASKIGIAKNSLILVSLFHAVGKLGNEKEDLYIENESQWHNERGIKYDINQSIGNITVAERSIWWLNKYKCPLTEEEISAILSLSHVGYQTNTAQFYNAPLLSIVLQTAVRVVCVRSTGRQSVLE